MSKRASGGTIPQVAKRGKTSKANVLAVLLSDPKYSDLEIHCRGKIFRVHRNIVCPQSRFLSACVGTGGGGFKEAQEGIIHLPDDEPHIVELLVQYLYTDDYAYQPRSALSSKGSATTAESSAVDQSWSQGHQAAVPQQIEPEEDYNYADFEMTVHTKVYIMADKFDIQDLKDLAREKLKGALSEDHLDIFTCVVEWVNDNTHQSDLGLRQLCMDFATKHFKALISRGEFYTFCKKEGVFPAELLRHVAETYNAVPTVTTSPTPSAKAAATFSVPKCPVCKRDWDVSLGTYAQQAKNGFRYRCMKCGHNFQAASSH